VTTIASMTQDTGEPLVGFERDVKPLFRERDRRSMLGSFDLWSYDDVRANADAILDRVSDGSMPCDTAWAPEQIDVLQRWIDVGMPS
jgi:hypothetical protein